MSKEHAEGQAGGFARQRFVQRRRAWRRRFWWVFPLVAIVPISIELPIALITHARNGGFWVGVGLGAGAAAAWVLFDSPPAHIESRARGAAFDLHSRLESHGPSPWVQAVVVLWADFDQRSIERDKVAWVRGDQLAAVLAARPLKFSGDDLEQLASATRTAVTRLSEDYPPPSGHQ